MFGFEFVAAVLARVVIAKEDVAPGKFYPGVVAPDESEEPDNSGLPYRYRNSADLVVVFLENFHLSKVDQGNSFSPR